MLNRCDRAVIERHWSFLCASHAVQLAPPEGFEPSLASLEHWSPVQFGVGGKARFNASGKAGTIARFVQVEGIEPSIRGCKPVVSPGLTCLVS